MALAKEKNTTEVNIRDKIDAEFLNPLKQCSQDDIFMLYFASKWSTMGSSIKWLSFREKLINTINIEKSNFVNDISNNNKAVQHWFQELMETTGYIDRISEEIQFRAVCYAMLVIDSGMASSVLEKWETVKKIELELNDGSTSSDSKDTIEKKKSIVRTGLGELAILNIQSNETGPVSRKLEMGLLNKARSSGELELQGIESDETESARDSEVQRLTGEPELQNVQSSEPGPLVGEVIHRNIHSNIAGPGTGSLEVHHNQSDNTGLAELRIQNVQSANDSGLAGEGVNYRQSPDESGRDGKPEDRNIRSNEIGVTRRVDRGTGMEIKIPWFKKLWL
ncbi:hypothetical protein BDQ17DRAFT_1335820 [Cyathus striatus]|nr:hypothetical protein BDQ17DRAFT_1335820 [Cyathus striatus]